MSSQQYQNSSFQQQEKSIYNQSGDNEKGSNKCLTGFEKSVEFSSNIDTAYEKHTETLGMSAEELEQRARELREQAQAALKTNEIEFQQAQQAQQAAKIVRNCFLIFKIFINFLGRRNRQC